MTADGRTDPSHTATAPAGRVRRNVDRLELLARAGKELAASLDYRATIQAVVDLTVPSFADSCTVAILQDKTLIHRLAAAHADPAKEALHRTLGDIAVHRTTGEHPTSVALRTGETRVYDDIPDELIRQMARNDQHLAVLRAMHYTAAVVIPLVAHDRRFGAVTFASTTPGRRFGRADVELAEELARRAAVAIDNALLYEEAQVAHADLRQSEEGFRLLFDANPLPMIVFDVGSLAILAVNAPALDQYGYTRGEFLAREMSDVWLPVDVDRRRASPADPTAGAFFNPAVSDHRGKDGRVLKVRVMTHSLTFAGRAARLLIMQNVGDQLRAEERTRRSDDRLKRALSAARMATFEWDVRTGVVERSPGFEALYGAEPGTMAETSDALLQRVHPDDRDRIRLAFETGPVERSIYDDEFRIVRADGSIRWIARRGKLYSDADGKPTHMVGTTTDVTERRLAEDEARRSDERLARILDNMGEGFFALDNEWRFTHVNRQAAAMIRAYDPAHTREAILGKTFYHVYPNARGLPVEAAFRAAQWTGTTQRFEHTSSRTGQWWELTICPSDDGLSVFYREVTERKRAEADREQILAERQLEAEHLRLLHERLRRSLDALLAIYEVGQVLTATRDIGRVGGRLLDIAHRAASLEAATIARVAPSGGLRLWKRSGRRDVWQAARRSPPARRARQAALETGRMQTYALPPQAAYPAGLGAWCLPLLNGERVVGLIEAFGRARPDEDATAEILGSMAHQLASAIQNARLYGELAANERALHELVGRLMHAQEDERGRLARDVHDGLAQLAIGAQMQIESFAHRNPPTTEPARATLDRIVTRTREVVVEVRRVLAGLRPQALEDYGLARALTMFLERLGAEGWDVTFSEGLGGWRLPRDVETALFRFAQEAVANVRKHAAAERVRVDLDLDERGVRLAVQDWGRGFDPEAPARPARPGEHLGILGMRERISLVGGHFEIVSRPGAGTRVVARVPVPVPSNGGPT